MHSFTFGKTENRFQARTVPVETRSGLSQEKVEVIEVVSRLANKEVGRVRACHAFKQDPVGNIRADPQKDKREMPCRMRDQRFYEIQIIGFRRCAKGQAFKPAVAFE